MFKSVGAMVLALLLLACGSSPGPLEGSWRSTGAVAPVTFKAGQMEAMGVAESVEYEVAGSEVTVTLTTGPAAGTAIKYVVKSPTLVLSNGQTYRKM